MVRVEDGHLTFDDVDESGYNQAMINPPLDELLWCPLKIQKSSSTNGTDGQTTS